MENKNLLEKNMSIMITVNKNIDCEYQLESYTAGEDNTVTYASFYKRDEDYKITHCLNLWIFETTDKIRKNYEFEKISFGHDLPKYDRVRIYENELDILQICEALQELKIIR